MTPTATFRSRAIRAAVRIHDSLCGFAAHTMPNLLPEAGWENLCRANRLYQRCQAKGWRTASASLAVDLDYAAHRVRQDLAVWQSGLVRPLPTSKLLSAGEIFKDLLALATEFEEVEIDLRAYTISVLTEAITLDEVALGSFRIVWQWQAVGHRPIYRCEA